MTDLPPLRDILKKYDLMPRKELGQNFIFDTNLLAKIVRQAGRIDHAHVIEVGPGPGGLTRAILAAGASSLTAIEKDTRCLAALAELSAWSEGRLTVIEGDALETDLLALTSAPRKLIANLPYNVATELLFRWLAVIYRSMESPSPLEGEGWGGGYIRTTLADSPTPHASPSATPLPLKGGAKTAPFESLTLMFQKEVAQRIVAPPGGKDYGRLAVMVQWLCEAYASFDIPPAAFIPPPKVTSTVVQIIPRARPLFPADKTALEAVLASAFGQRRKMLRGALKSLGVDAEALLAKAGIDPTRRAETLSVEEFCRLANAFRPSGQGPGAVG